MEKNNNNDRMRRKVMYMKQLHTLTAPEEERRNVTKFLVDC